MCAARRALTGIALAGVVTAGSTAVTPRAVAAENGLIAYTTGNGDETRYRVRTVRPDGTRGRVLLKANARFDGGPAGARWSPDGRKLVFAQYHRSHHAGKALWYATAAGKRVTRIPLGLGRVELGPQLGGYDWAPGGRRLVFSTGGMLYTIAIDGTRRRALGAGQHPRWSSDGRYIVYERNFKIYVKRPDATGLRLLTPFARASTPSFSPDGRQVLYAHNQYDYRLQWRVVDLSGKNDRLVASPNSANDGLVYCPPQWTPDGERISAIRTQDGPTNGDRSTAAFVTMKPDGSDVQVAFPFPFAYVGRYGMCDFSWQPR